MNQSISELTSELSRWADEDKAEAPPKVTPVMEVPEDYDFSRLETQLTRLNDLLEFYLSETLGYKKDV